MEKTAKEMFEELGYMVAVNDKEALIYLSSDNEFIYFILIEPSEYGKLKGYGAYKYVKYLEDSSIHKTSKNITAKEHLAITQQMKELGWID